MVVRPRGQARQGGGRGMSFRDIWRFIKIEWRVGQLQGMQDVLDRKLGVDTHFAETTLDFETSMDLAPITHRCPRCDSSPEFVDGARRCRRCGWWDSRPGKDRCPRCGSSSQFLD